VQQSLDHEYISSGMSNSLDTLMHERPHHQARSDPQVPCTKRYPDVIESCPPPGSGQKHSRTIKSHHNVDGLPKNLQCSMLQGHAADSGDLLYAEMTSPPGKE
jgi:hypothetical protein